MIPIAQTGALKGSPVRAIAFVTWTLVALNVLIYFWDRQWRWSGPNIVFADLMVDPSAVIAFLQGRGNLFSATTLFTAMFLHGSVWHLLGNLIFLVVFGPAVEAVIGSLRYALYYLAWGVFSFAAQIYVDPSAPVIGASGAIGGVLGAYLLLFPGSLIDVVIPPLVFLRIKVFAWILLGGWFLFQLLVPMEGVASWAHVGGFLAGMATILVMGGRTTVFARSGLEPDDV